MWHHYRLLLWVLVVSSLIVIPNRVFSVTCENEGDPCDDGDPCTVEDHCVCPPTPSDIPPPDEEPFEEAAPDDDFEEEVPETFRQHGAECVCVGNTNPECAPQGEELPPSSDTEGEIPPPPEELTPPPPSPFRQDGAPPPNADLFGGKSLPPPPPVAPERNPPIPERPPQVHEGPGQVDRGKRSQGEVKPLFVCFSESQEAIDLTTCNVAHLVDPCPVALGDDPMVVMAQDVQKAFKEFKKDLSRKKCALLRIKVARYIEGLPAGETPMVLKLTIPKKSSDAQASYRTMATDDLPALSTCLKTGDMILNDTQASLRIKDLYEMERPALVLVDPSSGGCSLIPSR